MMNHAKELCTLTTGWHEFLELGIVWEVTAFHSGTPKWALPKDYLDEALNQQGLKTAPNGFKQTWTENGYKYEVRVHAGEGQYTNAQSIYRVSRQQITTSGQGTGTYYLGTDGNWYHTSVLKEYLGNGQLNPIYDANAAEITHIPLK